MIGEKAGESHHVGLFGHGDDMQLGHGGYGAPTRNAQGRIARPEREAKGWDSAPTSRLPLVLALWTLWLTAVDYAFRLKDVVWMPVPRLSNSVSAADHAIDRISAKFVG